MTDSREIPLTSGQLAQSMGLSISSIQRLVASGMPHETTPGGKKRFSMAAVRDWLAAAKNDSKVVTATSVAEDAKAQHGSIKGDEKKSDSEEPRTIPLRTLDDDDRHYTDMDSDDAPACKIEINGSVVVLSNDSGIIVTVDFSRRIGHLVSVTEDDESDPITID